MLTSADRRQTLALALVAAATLVVWYSNQIAPHISNPTRGWNQAYLFPRMIPVGADFRDGVFNPGTLLSRGEDPYSVPALWYPPLSALVFLPYQAFDPGRAYSIHVLVLTLLNLACVWLAVRITRSTIPDRAPPEGSLLSIAPRDPVLSLCLAFLTISSYGFIFSLERGNFDIYAMALSLAGLWILLRSPSRLWLQVICFSAAAHLKVYPAVLLLLVFWKHGRSSLAPILVVNTAFLLCIGPGPAQHFVERLLGVSATTASWVGNHSAESFVQMANGFLGERGLSPIPGAVFLAPPLLIWLGSLVVLLRRGFSGEGAVWLFAVSVPLMNLVPSTSHDYKLVLLGAPIAILLRVLLGEYAASGKWMPFAQIVGACGLIVLLSLSYTAVPPVLGNKYPFILALQLLLAWVVLASPASLQRAIASDARPMQERSEI